eukprot:s3093_g1.t1
MSEVHLPLAATAIGETADDRVADLMNQVCEVCEYEMLICKEFWEDSSNRSDSFERAASPVQRPAPAGRLSLRSQRSSRLSHSSSRSFGRNSASSDINSHSENPVSHTESRPVVTFDEGEDAIGAGESWRV